MPIRALVSLAAAITLLGCAMLQLDPVIAEDRQVTAVVDPSKTVTVLEPMVWTNKPLASATKGVRLPAGTYALQAEDAGYPYFEAPGPIEVRVLKDGQPVDGRDFPGGLALAKGFNIVPAATYVDATEGTKTLIFKHGREFLEMRGSTWTKSF
jgi:hypothetical protein